MESLTWLYSQTRGGTSRTRMRMASVIGALQLPEPEHIILVSGTNGKGTIANALGYALTEAGVQTGVFTSPHIERFNERITVNRKQIPDNEVTRYIEWLREEQPRYAQFKPSFFELTLAIALRYFADQGVTHAVIEAGVGVMHDATNALKNYDLSIISNVTVDHENVLGNSVTEIARDKAFATRRNMPTVTGATGEALQVIQARADAVGGTLHVLSDDDLLFHTAEDSRPELRIAVAAARLLQRMYDLPEQMPDTVLHAPPLPARHERFYAGVGQTIIIDGAHNVAAAERLVNNLPRTYKLLFGALPKKDAAALFAILSRNATEIVLTNAGLLEDEAFRAPGVPFVNRPEEALELLVTQATPGDTIVIAGSFYLAGTLRPLVREFERRLLLFQNLQDL